MRAQSTVKGLKGLRVWQALAEMQTQVEIAIRLRCAKREETDAILRGSESLSRQPYALRNSLAAKAAAQAAPVPCAPNTQYPKPDASEESP